MIEQEEIIHSSGFAVTVVLAFISDFALIFHYRFLCNVLSSVPRHIVLSYVELLKIIKKLLNTFVFHLTEKYFHR